MNYDILTKEELIKLLEQAIEEIKIKNSIISDVKDYMLHCWDYTWAKKDVLEILDKEDNNGL